MSIFAMRVKTTPDSARRFPAPWSVEDIGAAFIVTDSGGQNWLMHLFDVQLTMLCLNSNSHCVFAALVAAPS
jgi:hypothetical protein